MQNLEIKIPSPCSMDWNGMIPNADGKYCISCEKTVVDFTKMCDGEILDYFKTYSDKRICGHFKSSQLSKNKAEKKSYLILLHKRLERIKVSPVRFLSLLLLGLVMNLVSCKPPESDYDVELSGDTTYAEPSATAEDTVEGEIAVEE